LNLLDNFDDAADLAEIQLRHLRHSESDAAFANGLAIGEPKLTAFTASFR
jgi:hypothetical protein